MSCLLSSAYAGVKIVILGSSTAAGAGVINSENAWVNHYRTYLQSIDPTSQVINLAKGGYTTCAIMPTGTPDYNTGSHILSVDTERNIDKALSYAPKGIIINMPTNDVSNGIPVDTQMKHFATIIEKAENSGVKVWITTSQPHNFGEKYTGPYNETNQPNGDKQRARDQFKELTEKILGTYSDRAIDFYTDIATIDGYSFIRPEYDSGDGVHLNDAAHAILFNKVKAKNIPVLLGDSSSDGILANPVYINFGPRISELDNWNDVIGQGAGTRLDVLNDISKVVTSLGLNILVGFTHAAENGSSSTIMEMNEAISKSNLSSNGEDPIIEFFGFNPKQVYNFTVFASRSGDGNRESTYTFTGANTIKATLDAASNTQNLAEVKAVQPNAAGKIVLTISKSTNNTSGFCYINAMKITSETPPIEIPEGAINVETAGTLASLLPEPIEEITSLTLYGTLNSTDIKTIRELPKLKDLDMKHTKIIKGGESYLNGMGTIDNVFPKEMFYQNKVIETVILPDGVIEAAYHAFMGCTALKKVVIPETVNTFGNDLFSGCNTLTDIIMPSKMTTINSGCFYNCKELLSITIPEGITAINGSLFYGCNKLEVINLPKTIETIGLWAFSACNALKEIRLGTMIKSIEAGAFYNCWSLNTITCEASTLPAITGTNGNSPFTGAFKAEFCTLHVPFTAYNKYKENAVWNVMSNIVTLETITANGNVIEPANADILKNASMISISGSTPDVEGLNSLLIENKIITSIDLTGVTEYLSTLTTGNPNCLIYLPAGTDIMGNNIIIENKAKSISLTDKMPFHAPMAFTAERIIYTRNLSEEGIPSGKQEAKGWRTITLPFTVKDITATNKLGIEVSLSSYDENGNIASEKNPFWLRKITPTGFVDTATLEANKPYIICFPNHVDYDDRYNITGEVTFISQNCNIEATPSFTAETGSEYNMTCTLKGETQTENIYAINEDGSAFEKNIRSISPFECYVTAKDPAHAPNRFLIESTTTTLATYYAENSTGYKIYIQNNEIVVESIQTNHLAIYDISGKLVRTEYIIQGRNIISGLKSGIYIIDNQKIIKL